jgi:hypothetical protein
MAKVESQGADAEGRHGQPAMCTGTFSIFLNLAPHVSADRQNKLRDVVESIWKSSLLAGLISRDLSSPPPSFTLAQPEYNAEAKSALVSMLSSRGFSFIFSGNNDRSSS